VLQYKAVLAAEVAAQSLCVNKRVAWKLLCVNDHVKTGCTVEFMLFAAG
jgi:hypothetical protein